MSNADRSLNVVSSTAVDSSSNSFEMRTDHLDLGQPDSFRYKLLRSIMNENYEQALQFLDEFLETDSQYPNFKEKIVRYVKHCKDLVHALKAKRNFPGISSLTRAKQQELREKYRQHLEELQYSLKRIEKVETDLRIQDVRSTIYVVKALWISGFAIVTVSFALEIFNGLAATGMVLFDDNINKFTNWLADLIGL